MQKVSQKFLARLTGERKRLQLVVEIYHQDAVPGENGFDASSSECLLRFALARKNFNSNIVFRAEEYSRLLRSVGRVSRTLKKQLGSFSFTLSNQSREIADFEDETGFEGLICVYRLIDAEISTELEDSIVLFTGRCEKPDAFERSSETVKISVKQILNQTEVNIPRRKFTVDDPEGRAPSDPLFEGFIYTPRQGTVAYFESEKKRFLFFFTKKKDVLKTMQYSSHSDLQSEAVAPLALGRVQAQGINFAYEDTGTGIHCVTFFSEGEIAEYVDLRSITPGFPLSATVKKYGKLGGTVDDATHQTNDDPARVGSGIYSRLAYVRSYATGSRNDTEDPAPDIVSILLGVKIPVPADNFTTSEWSDSGVLQSRWILTSKDFFGLDENWIDDEETIESADYCDHILVDQANTESVFLHQSQQGVAGVGYSLYRSTGHISPEYFLKLSGSSASYEAFTQEAAYDFYNVPPMGGDDPDGDGLPDYLTPPTFYRRRYTSNLYLTEQMKAIDFLFDILFPASNLYPVQKATGKLAIRVAKPVDFSFVETSNSKGEDELLIKNINPFKANPGRVLIGANTSRSEVRKILSARYKSDVSISVAVSGGLTRSSATLTGGSDDVAPSAVLTCTSAAGTKTISIGDFTLTYVPRAGETTVTIAAMIAAMVNSHNELNKFIKAVWNAGDAFCTISSRIGFVALDAPLEYVQNVAIANPSAPPSVSAATGGSLAIGKYYLSYSFETEEGETLVSPVLEFNLTTSGKKLSVGAIARPSGVLRVNWYCSVEANGIRRRLIKQNDGSAFIISELPLRDEKVEPSYNDTAAEIHRIALAFADKGNSRSNLSRSNTIGGNFKFPLGSRQASTNRIVIPFRDSAADFKLTELRINDRAHQKKVKKTNDLKINGAAIDNFHQARRIGNQKMAEQRDGDKFYALSGDGEALLLEEGDVVCVTDESGRFVNEPCRIEDVDFDEDQGFPHIVLTARKYRRRYYDDQIQERLVPLPIVTNSDVNTEQNAPTLYLISAFNAAITIGVQNYSVAAAYRKIEVSTDADFSVPANITIIIENSVNALPGFILNDRFTITRSTNLENAETRYVRVAHSSNGVTFGAYSSIKTVVFPDENGDGGSPPDDPDMPPTTGGSGDDPPGLPDGDCFVGETLVTLANGDRKTFEFLYENREKYVGRSAKAFDENNNLQSGKIMRIWKSTSDKILEVEFSNGSKLRAVKTHRFWTEHKRFASVYLLTEGEKVWIQNNLKWELAAIEKMRMLPGEFDIYNMTVENWHDYFAGDENAEFAVSNQKPR